MRQLISIIKGVVSWLPFSAKLVQFKGTGGSDSAGYCYGVWMKHLVFLHENGYKKMPLTMAELGPGDSLGLGLAALLCGVNEYYALDILKYSNTATNLKMLEDLVQLFKKRTGIEKQGWPDFSEFLDENNFPSHILTNELLERSLSEGRIEKIRKALKNPDGICDEIKIQYIVPWNDASKIRYGTIDLIISQSVLEYVQDLDDTYQKMKDWLSSEGVISHQIDLKSHRLTNTWNGHWTVSPFIWRLMKGNRPSMITRYPGSAHINSLTRIGFKLIGEFKAIREDGIDRSRLSKAWKNLSDEDIMTSGLFFQARII